MEPTPGVNIGLKTSAEITEKIELSVVVPAFNEEDNVLALYERLSPVLDAVTPNHEIIFVDDGSHDRTVEKVLLLRGGPETGDKRVKLVSFSRNFGHEMANTAGFRHASGGAVVIIDADLQDPPELIADMYNKFLEGFDVVYAKRISRKKESFLKQWTSKSFYKVMNALSDLEVPLDTGDFRLLSRRVVDELNKLEEHNRYFRGLTHWVGFNVGYVVFHRDERHAGETKYNYIKLFRLAFDAIISFSYKPLKIFSLVGFMVSGLSFLLLIYWVLDKIFWGNAVEGWTSLAAIMLFSFGLLMIQISIVGEYVGRIHDEVKRRPLFIVSRKEGFAKGDSNEQRP
jgi:dolichol-phosphate mannosyltransferase